MSGRESSGSEQGWEVVWRNFENVVEKAGGNGQDCASIVCRM